MQTTTFLLGTTDFQAFPLLADDGHGDYNRSYENNNNDIDYADYSTDHRDNNYRNFEKKPKIKSEKERIQDILNRWD